MNLAIKNPIYSLSESKIRKLRNPNLEKRILHDNPAICIIIKVDWVPKNWRRICSVLWLFHPSTLPWVWVIG